MGPESPTWCVHQVSPKDWVSSNKGRGGGKLLEEVGGVTGGGGAVVSGNFKVGLKRPLELGGGVTVP